MSSDRAATTAQRLPRPRQTGREAELLGEGGWYNPKPLLRGWL